MEYNLECEEIFNSAFIDPSDLKYSPDTWSELNLSNCYLDPYSEEFSLEQSIPRVASQGLFPRNQSPLSVKSKNSVLDPIYSDGFDLPDSCLLFTTHQNMESNLTELSNGSPIEEDKLHQSSDVSEKKSDSNAAINCKHVISYLMRPFSSKLVKKINKKFKKPLAQEEQNVQSKIPVQIYSSKACKSVSDCDPGMDAVYIPKISHSNRLRKLNENNFVNCGDLVTYFV